jgi:L-ascorbate metabolism protein UlaG (beta-lactamase superfamily)
MLHIRWHGQSCFTITDQATVIITDPHDGATLNLPPPPTEADAVTVSHDHSDHNSGVKRYKCPVFTEPIDTTIGTAKLRGVECWHDDQRGRRLGNNITWNITMEGIQVTHLGDLGHYLTPSQMFQIGVPDILMINTGADIPMAEDNIALLSPKIIIPMHYYTPGIDFPFYHLKSILDFTEGKQNVVQMENEHTYTRDTIPYRPEIHVYRPPRKQR